MYKEIGELLKKFVNVAIILLKQCHFKGIWPLNCPCLVVDESGMILKMKCW